MDNVLQSQVADGVAPQPLVAWLAARFGYFDASEWHRQLGDGRVHVNGTVAAVDATVGGGDRVAFRPPQDEGDGDGVPVLHVDDDLVVVDKPPHRVVQHGSIVRGAMFLGELARRHPPTDGTARLEPVHRLDRETSGVLVIARSRAAFRAMQRQFEAGTVAKHYVAVVEGLVAADRFTIDAPIGTAHGSVVAARRAVLADAVAGARPARTDVVVETRLAAHTVLAVAPRTGRTHQIRVHLAHAGHPLVGDKLYGRSDDDYLAWVRHLKTGGDPGCRDGRPVLRQLLHADRLECRHPRTGEPIVFAADRPADLCAFVTAAPR